jgi:hypothetical protein
MGLPLREPVGSVKKRPLRARKPAGTHFRNQEIQTNSYVEVSRMESASVLLLVNARTKEVHAWTLDARPPMCGEQDQRRFSCMNCCCVFVGATHEWISVI